MGDQKPPRLAGGECVTLLALLQYQRESPVRKVAGVNESAARRSPVGSGTSLLWLIKHMAQAEITWMLQRFAGQDVEIPDDTPGPDDTLAAAVQFYRATWERLTHLLEETARHAGHADILAELIDGRTGR